ncbi:MAG: phage antirepressor N-terminal domain-containing protein [Desulfobacterales bacterium]|nr:phage antirepressor N-terminal domain-containing protein [Desulfobacterales bacterium]
MEFTCTDICIPDSRGREQEHLCLPLDEVHGWLSHITFQGERRTVYQPSLNSKQSCRKNGTELLAIEDDKGVKWVAAKPICQGMGVDWMSQYRKLKKDPKFTNSVMPIHDSMGRNQRTICLPLDEVHGWLFSINANWSEGRAENGPRFNCSDMVDVGGNT